MKLFSVPNLITLGNLLCGCLAVVFAFEGNLVWSAYLVGIAAVLDFLDGFAARALKQYSPIGKELDSLADMVTFGFVPGVVMFQLLKTSFFFEEYRSVLEHVNSFPVHQSDLAYSLPFCSIAFVITLFSALRLAKFNIDTRQSDSFIGVPTPANAILICALPLVIAQMSRVNFSSPEGFLGNYNYVLFGGILHGGAPEICAFLLDKWVLAGITIGMSVLLISEIPLFSLKIKSFGWKGNELRYSFLAACLVLLIVFKFAGLPLAIVLYILLSVINNSVRKKKTTPAEPQA